MVLSWLCPLVALGLGTFHGRVLLKTIEPKTEPSPTPLNEAMLQLTAC